MQLFSQAETADDFNEAANAFSRIADVSKDEYLPDYYAALTQIIESFYLTDAGKRDEIIAQAQEHIAKADALSPGNDEVEVMKGYALMAKMVVDPQSRAQQYSPMIMQSFGKARAMNPNNPRAVILMARMKYGNDQFFGKKPTEACTLAKQGKDLLDKETVEGFQPHWGAYSVQEILAACE